MMELSAPLYAIAHMCRDTSCIRILVFNTSMLGAYDRLTPLNPDAEASSASELPSFQGLDPGFRLSSSGAQPEITGA